MRCVHEFFPKEVSVIVNFHTVCHSFFANFPSNQRFTKELYSKLIWRKKNLGGSKILVFRQYAILQKFRETNGLDR